MTTTVKVDFRSLPLEERVRKFANGRPKVDRLWQVDEVSRKLVGSWIGKLCGVTVTNPAGNFKFETEADALYCAQSFKGMAQDELKSGLIDTVCPGCGVRMQFAVGRSHSKCPACGETWDQYMKRLELIA